MDKRWGRGDAMEGCMDGQMERRGSDSQIEGIGRRGQTEVMGKDGHMECDMEGQIGEAWLVI